GAPDANLPPGPRGDVLRVPETAHFPLPTLHAPVEVIRTEANVPHVYASDAHDLFVAEGFVVARDRYAEFELGRRIGLGRLSELLGEPGLATDVKMRGQGMRALAERL